MHTILTAGTVVVFWCDSVRFTFSTIVLWVKFAGPFLSLFFRRFVAACVLVEATFFAPLLFFALAPDLSVEATTVPALLFSSVPSACPVRQLTFPAEQ